MSSSSPCTTQCGVFALHSAAAASGNNAAAAAASAAGAGAAAAAAAATSGDHGFVAVIEHAQCNWGGMELTLTIKISTHTSVLCCAGNAAAASAAASSASGAQSALVS